MIILVNVSNRSHMGTIFSIKGHGSKLGAAVEGFIADGSDGVGDGHGSKPGAAGEGGFADGSDGVGDGHGSESGAAFEGGFAD